MECSDVEWLLKIWGLIDGVVGLVLEALFVWFVMSLHIPRLVSGFVVQSEGSRRSRR